MIDAMTSARMPKASLRVILVGTTGLEQSIRQSEEIELIRARTGLDAIGEHGLPMAGGPERTLVVLGPEFTRTDDAAELIRALRRVDARVKVAAVRSSKSDDGPHAATDAVIEANADAQTLLKLMQAPEAVSPNGMPGHAAKEHSARAEAAANVGVMGQHDVTILRVLLSGGDILQTCIEIAATSDSRGPVSFHPIEIAEEAPSIGEGMGVEAVAHHGRSFGWLTGPTAGSEDSALRQSAEWLAHWMALREQHRQLYSAAFTDSLTGAWNRRYFERFLESAIKDAQRRRHSLTILIFDIDDFKHYNDTYGHPAGDEILTETVRLLRSVVRPSDKVCRIGGDEFAVIFHEPEGPREAGSRHPGSISAIATRFQRQIAAARFPKLGADAKGRLTISGGLATYPWDGHSVETLVGRADELVLDSKRQGKNVICFGPDSTPTGDDDGVSE